jgi:hypothetical protein
MMSPPYEEKPKPVPISAADLCREKTTSPAWLMLKKESR